MRKKNAGRRPGLWISALGLLALGALFVLWWLHEPQVSAAGRIAALLSAGLFAALCLRFVPTWMAFWRPAPAGAAPLPAARETSDDAPAHMGIKIFAALLAVDALVILLVFLLRRLSGYGGSFAESLTFWQCTDSRHYLDIARDWYLPEGPWDRLVQLVFLPGYPVTVRLVDLVVGNTLYAGLLVSALSFAFAGCVLYRLLRLDLPHRDAQRTLRCLCLLPGVFFFTAPMSESLFLLLCAACLYCARTGRWTAGCLLGGLAAFTRTLGLTLLVPLFFECIHSLPARRQAGRGAWLTGRLAALLLIPAGFGVYLAINYAVAGDPFQFLEYQRVHWGQSFGLFFNTAAYQTEEAIRNWTENRTYTLGLWGPNLIASFGALILLLCAAKRLRPSYTAWFIAYFFIAIGTTWLLSAPRYLLSLISVPLAASLCTRDPRAERLALPCCALASLLYLCAFVMRWSVW